MSATMARSVENILLATLHKVGGEVRLEDNTLLAKMFNNAAEKQRDLFGQFAWHRHYHVSDRLSEAFQILDLSGEIVRENAAQTYFRVSPHAAGPFGESVFESFSQGEQKMIEEVAAKIAEAFSE